MSNLPPAIKLYKGVSIYKVTGSPYWYVRVWDRQRKKYVVKSTGEESSLLARDVAQDVALSLLKKEKTVALEYTFKYFGLKMLNNMQREARLGNKSPGYVKSLLWAIQNEDWGLLNHFGSSDVRDLKTHSFQEYMAELTAKRPDIKASTKNTLMAAFRNVLKVARDEGLIDVVPQTPRAKQRDNPRPFFRFHPLVNKEDDAYKKLLAEAKRMAQEEVVVRGVKVTDDLYDLIMFLTHSFVRPITTELYAIRHSDVVVASDPKRLVVTVRDGKTGFRSANTMPAAVAVYERLSWHTPKWTAQPNDLFAISESRAASEGDCLSEVVDGARTGWRSWRSNSSHKHSIEGQIGPYHSFEQRVEATSPANVGKGADEQTV